VRTGGKGPEVEGTKGKKGAWWEGTGKVLELTKKIQLPDREDYRGKKKSQT